MSVNLVRKVRLLVGAGAAKPGPAIGQALGPLGINMAEFCKQFNEATKNLEKEIPIPVVLSAFSNRSFTFQCKTPPTSWFLKKCAGIETGAGRPGHDIVGNVHVKQIYEIAKVKLKDEHLSHLQEETMCRMIAASAGSMGIKVVASESEIAEIKKTASTATGDKKAGDKKAADKKAPAAAADKKAPAAATPAAAEKKK